MTLARTPRLLALVACACFVTGGCAELPDTSAILQRHDEQSARFNNARGQLSDVGSAAVLAGLKRQSGDIDILEKQIVLEQRIVGSPLVVGNRVTLLLDGAATYAAMLTAIRQARDHINLESYIFEDDEIGRQFAAALLERQTSGVQVNLIYDSVGGVNTPRAFFDRLAAAGVAVLEFNPLNPLAARSVWRIYNRDHRKLLVVDGRIAFVGGINISSVFSSGSVAKRSRNPRRDSQSWRDTDLQIEGPVVAEFQKLFLETWRKQHGTPLLAKAYFPPLIAVGKEVVRAIGSSPDDPYSLIYLTLISAIGNAESRVYLTHAYFVPDPQLRKALSDAAGRGVDVKLILPGQSDSDSSFHAGRAYYTALLRAGVKLYERRGAMLHAKTVVIDGVWSCVGSSNLDWRSFLDNDEVNAVVLGREFGGQMEAMYAADLAAADAVDVQAWQQRPWLLRFKEWMAGLIERFL